MASVGVGESATGVEWTSDNPNRHDKACQVEDRAEKKRRRRRENKKRARDLRAALIAANRLQNGQSASSLLHDDDATPLNELNTQQNAAAAASSNSLLSIPEDGPHNGGAAGTTKALRIVPVLPDANSVFQRGFALPQDNFHKPPLPDSVRTADLIETPGPGRGGETPHQRVWSGVMKGGVKVDGRPGLTVATQTTSCEAGDETAGAHGPCVYCGRRGDSKEDAAAVANVDGAPSDGNGDGATDAVNGAGGGGGDGESGEEGAAGEGSGDDDEGDDDNGDDGATTDEGGSPSNKQRKKRGRRRGRKRRARSRAQSDVGTGDITFVRVHSHMRKDGAWCTRANVRAREAFGKC